MTNSQATALITFNNGSQQVYNLDATDGTEGAMTELISGSEIGTAAQGLAAVNVQIQCENQCEYVTLLDELGTIQWSLGGCDGESLQPGLSSVPAVVIGLNYSLKVLTAAS